MRKAKQDVDDEFSELPYVGGDLDDVDFGLSGDDADERDGSAKRKPARQRVELRNEQKSLREQLSDWDDYSDFDTDL
ncbi:MAG TPA: hypothetical protein VFV10_08155 [Gammaproteobacteria bacterium]|nr:hypothetical protein [Gammaproteobacteria bacterium]